MMVQIKPSFVPTTTPVTIYKRQQKLYRLLTAWTIHCRLPRIEAFELRGPSFGGVILFSCAEMRRYFSNRLPVLRYGGRVMDNWIVFVGYNKKTRFVSDWPFRDELRRCKASYVGSIVPHRFLHGRRHNDSEYGTVVRVFKVRMPWLVQSGMSMVHLGHIHDFIGFTLGTFAAVKILSDKTDPRIYRSLW